MQTQAAFHYKSGHGKAALTVTVAVLGQSFLDTSWWGGGQGRQGQRYQNLGFGFLLLPFSITPFPHKKAYGCFFLKKYFLWMFLSQQQNDLSELF